MEKYKRYTQLEHVLARPDTYVSSTEKENVMQWTYDKTKERMEETTVTTVPALYKIYDEIIVNAIDQSQVDASVDTIKINVSKDEVSVYNTGKGIPIETHKTEGIMIPELIFGNLLTSENYDDSKKRTTGGRNGYGAKLANIFSKEFRLEIVDPSTKKKYVQTWENNMKTCHPPTITKSTSKKGHVQITFKPDLERFGLKEIPEKIFERRAYDCCACTHEKVKVYYNDKQLPYKTFEKYAELYLGTKSERPRVFMKNERWEVIVAFSEEGYKQVSFVNGINTTQGGAHVEAILRNIITKMQENNKKNIELKPTFIKEHLFIMIKATLENPTFSSQTKTECTSKWSTFGSRLDISDEDIKKICKLGILQEAQALAKHKEQRDLEKSSGGTKKVTLRGIPKLDDANNAGGSKSKNCTLILTEGDSAKTFAISGLSIIGRNEYGVFPLKGKLLNTREASTKQLQNNEEISNIVKILGLKYGTKYSTLENLRYGKIMILTDSDLDGYHIRGLIMNFIHSFWPELMHLDFICSFQTPIMKATKGRTTHVFYTLQEYEKWKETEPHSNTWKIKYYKGLGTSTANEAKDYFREMDKHKIEYEYAKKSEEAIKLAFQKDLSNKRKEWIQDTLKKEDVTLPSKGKVKYEDFVNKELVHFSIYDNVRSIPSMIDGLKPSQRKVLYGSRKRSNTEIKVSQLSGYVSVESAYHHGEASLQQTIIGMAQNFVGTGWYNLLEPIGQFGTRLMGGKDHASPRYIFTQLSEYANIFDKRDDFLLDYAEDDGQKIEPKYYVPVLPLILLNGTQGIGTGYSTDIPAYHPNDIIENINLYMDGKKMKEMKPSYKNFKGKVIQEETNGFITKGVYEKGNKKTFIKELPIGRWTEDYKEHLEKLVEKGIIKNYENHSTEEEVSFVVHEAAGVKEELLEKELKLTSTIKTSNMWLFNEEGVITKYATPLEILTDFCKVRLKYYEKRKEYLLQEWNREVEELTETYRFIKEVIDGTLVVFKRKKEEILKEMTTKGYQKKEALINISLVKFTKEELQKLKRKIEGIEEDIKDLTQKTKVELYREDIKKMKV